MRRSRSKSAHKCIPYNNRCVQNVIHIGLDLAVRGPKTCFAVKTVIPSYRVTHTKAQQTVSVLISVNKWISEMLGMLPLAVSENA